MTTKRSLSILGPVIALAVALALVLAGCGGEPFPRTQATPTQTQKAATLTSNSNAAPRVRLLAAVQRATTSKTARVTMNEALSGFTTEDGDSPSSLSIGGSGVIDLVSRSLEMHLVGNTDGDTQAIELRVVNRTIYIGENGSWTSQPFTGVDATTPVPNSYLDYLRGVSSDVRVVGHETLRGSDTIRYSATLDLVQAASRATAATERSSLEQAINFFGAAKIPVSVWIDDLGRLRKLQMLFDLSAVAEKLGMDPGAHPKIDLAMELYDFGLPVSVQVPANAESQAAVTQDRTAQSDLRNALTAEKTTYTDDMVYSSDPQLLQQIEPTLDWGGKLSIGVGAAATDPKQVVCLSERSASGRVFSIADVADGPNAGTYYAKKSCPGVVTDQIAFTFTHSW